VRPHGSSAARLATALAGAIGLALAACSGDDDTPSTASRGTTTTAAAPVAGTSEDGELRLGLLLPMSGAGADLGASLRHGAELAIEQINDAGGHAGRPVRAILRDEGDDVATAAVSLDELVAEDVDAIVGPASSIVALNVLGTTRREGLVVCSPTATALALDDYPDDGLFFRTAPSDSLQAEAIARAVDQTGLTSVSVLHIDDAYGRAFADEVAVRLGTRSIALAADVPFEPGASELDDEVARALEAEVVVVIGDSTTGARAVAEVLRASRESGTPVVVNDTMRGSTIASSTTGLTSRDFARVTGVGPRAITDDLSFLQSLRERSPETEGMFAVGAFDCVNLIALAAREASSSAPSAIASRITTLATGGTRCTSFESCVDDLAEGRNVDYDGPSGLLQLDARGDPNRSVFDLFTLDQFGRELLVSSVTVST